MNLTPQQLQNIIEAAIMASERPMAISNIQKLFDHGEEPSTQEIKLAISALKERYIDSGLELTEVASGFRFQVKAELSTWIGKLWEERPPRYSRALLETLALIAYRQPITRAEIEDIRGVSTSSHIIKTLLEREWVQVVGVKEVPGRPELFGTTKSFLDYFNLKSLDGLPTLAEIKDLDTQVANLQVQLDLNTSIENSENVSDKSDENTQTENVPSQAENESETINSEIVTESESNHIASDLEPTDNVKLTVNVEPTDSDSDSDSDLELESDQPQNYKSKITETETV